MNALHDCRIAFAAALDHLAASDSRIVAVTNDATSSSKLSAFAKKYPQQFVNVGIAEQNLIGIAAGLANGGKIPFVSGAACFLTARALEQIKADLAYSRANVKVCGMSSGVAYGPLGPTHHSIEDIAWLRAIADMTILVPCDPVETTQAVLEAAEFEGPVFIRVSRMGVPVLLPEDYEFHIGQSTLMRQGTDVTLIANGTLVWKALQAAELLVDQGIQARVINMSTVKPLDRDAVIRAANETAGIVTVEEATVSGGMGSAVAEVVVQSTPVPMRLLGIPSFAPTGPMDFLFEHFHLTPESIAQAALDVVQQDRQRWNIVF
ncbi:MAG: transketolase family protein [Anaerolineae bacterium]|nr:transketolase family protein [Anaerolineae bacterium]